MSKKVRQRLKKALPFKIKLVAIMMATCILVIIGTLMLTTWKNTETIESKTITYQYMQKANIGYEVLLKPNMLFTENKLGMGCIYPSNFTDQLLTTFRYQFSGDKKAQLKGKYCVVATVQGEQIEEKKVKVLWSKDFLLIPETPFNSTEASAAFAQEVPVNYETFNYFAEEVQKATEITAQAKLVINCKINIEAMTNDGLVKETLTPKITLPLGKKYFEVEGELTSEKPGCLESVVETQNPVNRNKVIALSIGILLCVLVLIYLVFFVEGVSESFFEKQVKRIFKQHGERLVGLEQALIVTKEMAAKVIKVKTIEDLVRIADETCKPIYYNNKAIEQRKIVPFYVLDKEQVFAYYLRPSKKGTTLKKIDGKFTQDKTIKA